MGEFDMAGDDKAILALFHPAELNSDWQNE
jgi:hypothetical protein